MEVAGLVETSLRVFQLKVVSHIPKDSNILIYEQYSLQDTRLKIYPSVVCLFFIVMRNSRYVL